MNANSYEPIEFQALLDIATCGELDSLQREQLNTILRHSDHAVRIYSEQLAIQSALAFRSASQPFAARQTEAAIVPAAVQTAPMARKTHPILIFGERISANWQLSRVAAVLAVAVGFYGTFALVASNMRSSKFDVSQNESRPVNSTASAGVKPPAVLVSTENATAAEASESFALGRTFRMGEVVELRSGLAEIVFANGAHVIMQGPARMTIDSSSQGRLTLGKLVAQVPPPAIGFTIETPTTRIVDLGTEFAAEVSADGASDVHVLTGLVAVSPPDSVQNPAAKPVELRAGQSIAVPQGGSLPAVAASSPARASQFVRSLKAPASGLPTIEFSPSQGNNPSKGVHLRLASGSTLEAKGLASNNDGALRVPNGSQTFMDLDCSERGPFAEAGFVERGKIGRDGTTLYVSWLTRCEKTNDDAYAGTSFMLFGDREVSSDERLFIGKPFKTPRFGIDLLNGQKPTLDADSQTAGDQPVAIDTSMHRFVVRIRFHAGADDVAVFVDPARHEEPSTPSAAFIAEVAFDRLRFAVGDKSDNQNSACWQFDELRFGRDWNAVVAGK